MSDTVGPRWLRTLELHNFQSHEHTVLEFVPGVNVIRGKNSCGKSAVFRALRFLAYNRPTQFANESLIRSGKSSCVVKATMSDGSWVLREKGKDVNRYVVSSSMIRGGQVELNNFGLSVPADVTTALGFGPLTVAKTEGMELNLSAQGEGAFMLSETDPEIARWMYALTSLDDIRAAIDDLTLDHKRSGQAIKGHEERVVDIGRQLVSFDGLDERSAELSEIETAIKEIEVRTRTRDDMQKLLDDMVNLRNLAVPVKRRSERNALVLTVLTDDALSGVEQAIGDVTEIMEISSKIERMNPDQAALQQRVSTNTKIAKVSFDGFDDRIEVLRQLSELSSRITEAETARDKATVRADISRRKAEEASEKYETFKMETFSSTDGETVCPTCGTGIAGDMLEHILEGH
jgi:exonuclease SbcC